MFAYISVLVSVLFLATVHCNNNSWFTREHIRDIHEIQDTKGLRYKKEAAAQNTPPFENDKDGLLPEFPHIVSIVPERGRTLCLGVLISVSFVLAPGNCLSSQNNQLFVIIDGERLNISKKIVHPMYSSRSTLYDIGLLKIDINDDIKSNIQPACLWLEDKLSFSKITLVGARASGPLKQTASINVQNAETCKPYYDYAFSSQGQSLVDHQMCVFYDFEEHWKWRIKIIYMDIISDNFIVPFVIGIPSFFVIGDSQKFDVFVKLSKFGEWITETMRGEGEEISFELTECIKRHSNERRKINGMTKFIPGNTRDFMVMIYESPDKSKECAGALIEKDIVITLAQCASNLKLHSSRVMFFSRKTIAIRDIIIHPDYMENSVYNNIAILKLESEAPFIHAQLEPYYFKDHNVFLNCRKNVEYNDFSSFYYFSVNELSVLFSYECNPSVEQRIRLSKGLLPEHMCIRNEQTIDTNSCVTKPGSPIYWVNGDTNNLLGLYMNGENCTIGEQAIIIYVYAHMNWIDSVINSR
ncbi:uncharacterized protein LOC133393244 [Anopheles gambiae]|uniref:Peptidase S1 domain-containing protein n=1 Tax=Anopheles coluzzii TaxID=1518534 RepID=A0A6E8WC30_ANOCL|nr:uncharacterized protein LOC120959616 [Anopheles coluzzii]XP_061513154.1 uncharacterized protein LOC133393244 [Anopheles gambiae]